MGLWKRLGISLLFIPMVAAFQGVGQGAVWKVFEEGKAFFYYYFEETMRKTSDGIVSVWVRTIPYQNIAFEKVVEERQKAGILLPIGNQDYGYSLMFMKIHCGEGKAKIIQEKIFNKKGFLLKSYLNPAGWKTLSQGSFEKNLSGQICPDLYVQK